MKLIRSLRVAVLLAATVGPAQAEPPSPPPFYAITNVQVVTGTGQTLEGATVLIADGLIEAVGAGVTVPGDAWVIDGQGMMLLPGLIDALTTVGQRQEDESAGGAGMGGPPGRANQPEIRGPEDRPNTTTWLAAADRLGEDARVEKWRESGFAAAVTAPEEGIFAGQAALINLGEGRDPTELPLLLGLLQGFEDIGHWLRIPSAAWAGRAWRPRCAAGSAFSDLRCRRPRGPRGSGSGARHCAPTGCSGETRSR